ncbi:MAG: cupin domain-containing protein [Desulfuromonadaceae bacterium]|nr:cupin domain-containing protein [Desulfuromonadaceae bacterium]
MNQKFNNLFDGIPATLPEEIFQTLAERGNIRIERIVSEGHTTPEGEWYDQSWDEWVILLTGSAGLLFDGEPLPRTMNGGDYVMIPSGCRHRVEWTDPDLKTVWLAVHFGESKPGAA